MARLWSRIRLIAPISDAPDRAAHPPARAVRDLRVCGPDTGRGRFADVTAVRLPPRAVGRRSWVPGEDRPATNTEVSSGKERASQRNMQNMLLPPGISGQSSQGRVVLLWGMRWKQPLHVRMQARIRSTHVL